MLNQFVNIYQRSAARRMFTRWAPSYEQDVAENAYSAADAVAAAAIKYLAKSAETDPCVADIGIGTGLLAQQIYDAMPCRITGLDFTEDMLAQCGARDITELLIKCDAGRGHWPLADESQHAVIASGLFEYLTPDMARHFMKEAARTLAPQGVLVFTYLPAAQGERKTRLWFGKTGTNLSCSYDPEEIESLARENGMQMLEHSEEFTGSVFKDGSSYPYRLAAARKP
ncbi:MAG: class I SAM-dependent methyltransferase [Micavibrio sp.]